MYEPLRSMMTVGNRTLTFRRHAVYIAIVLCCLAFGIAVAP